MDAKLFKNHLERNKNSELKILNGVSNFCNILTVFDSNKKSKQFSFSTSAKFVNNLDNMRSILINRLSNNTAALKESLKLVRSSNHHYGGCFFFTRLFSSKPESKIEGNNCNVGTIGKCLVKQ